MSHGEVCAHINTELCVQGGEGNENGVMGVGGGVAGIQLTGTSFQYHLEGDYPVCRDKRGEEGTDEEQEQKDQQVRGHRQKGRICFRFKQSKRKQGQNNLKMPSGRNSP